jgi:hypothetical protein
MNDRGNQPAPMPRGPMDQKTSDPAESNLQSQDYGLRFPPFDAKDKFSRYQFLLSKTSDRMVLKPLSHDLFDRSAVLTTQSYFFVKGCFIGDLCSLRTLLHARFNDTRSISWWRQLTWTSSMLTSRIALVPLSDEILCELAQLLIEHLVYTEFQYEDCSCDFVDHVSHQLAAESLIAEFPASEQEFASIKSQLDALPYISPQFDRKVKRYLKDAPSHINANNPKFQVKEMKVQPLSDLK